MNLLAESMRVSWRFFNVSLN